MNTGSNNGTPNGGQKHNFKYYDVDGLGTILEKVGKSLIYHKSGHLWLILVRSRLNIWYKLLKTLHRQNCFDIFNLCTEKMMMIMFSSVAKVFDLSADTYI